MRKRWAVICRDVDGKEIQRHEFVFRASARRYARGEGGEYSLPELKDDRAHFVEYLATLAGRSSGVSGGLPRMYTVEVVRL